MKKSILLFLCLEIALCVGCGTVQTKKGEGETNAPAEEKLEADEDLEETDEEKDFEIVFQPPAEVIEIDKKAEDPSNDYINFVYDEEGRISQCYYKLDNEDIYLNYTYEGNSAHILGFSGEILAADEIIKIPNDYAGEIGFTTYMGYFFKGYEF